MNHYAKAAHANNLVGRRVRVLQSCRYGAKCTGCYGTIQAAWGLDSIAVDLDFRVNKGSQYGYFYFKSSELEFIKENKEAETAKEGEEKMEKLTKYANVAEVQFVEGYNPGTSKCANYDTALSVNDLCVVMTPCAGLALARVTAISEHTDAELFDEVVVRLDVSAYESRVEHRKKSAELKGKMQERAKQLQDVVLYQTLAKEDPEMAAMLKEYLDLNS
jgi:hypothetical protein